MKTLSHLVLWIINFPFLFPHALYAQVKCNLEDIRVDLQWNGPYLRNVSYCLLTPLLLNVLIGIFLVSCWCCMMTDFCWQPWTFRQTLSRSKVRGSLINALRQGRKTKNRKVVRWIWLSKQNEIKIPEFSAPTSSTTSSCWVRTHAHAEIRAYPEPGEHRRIFNLERSNETTFHRNPLPRAPWCRFPVSAIRAVSKSPMIFESLGRARKLPR